MNTSHLVVSLLLVTSALPAVRLFRCDSLASDWCSYSSHHPDHCQLICPQHLKVNIHLPVSVHLHCGGKPPDLSVLTGLVIGKVQKFTLTYCPLGNTSVGQVLSAMRITSIKSLYIDSDDSLKYSLQNDEYHKTKSPNLQVSDPFTNLTSLKSLYLYRNQLGNITRSFLAHFPQLQTLYLKSNSIDLISQDFLAGSSKINNIEFSHNVIKAFATKSGVFDKTMENNTEMNNVYSRWIFSNITYLKSVEISGLSITHLNETMFLNQEKIEMLCLKNNSINTVSQEALNGLQNLRILDISHNNIYQLPSNLFKNIKKLTVLKMQSNNLLQVSSGLFSSLYRLRYLDLSSNKLTQIEKEDFEHLISLRVLNITNNKITTLMSTSTGDSSLTTSVLENCKFLEELQVANNSISKRDEDWRFSNMLTFINLAFNNYSSFKIHEFNLISGGNVDLSNNNITSINVDVDEYMYLHISKKRQNMKTTYLTLENNPFVCDCHLETFASFIKRKQDFVSKACSFERTVIVNPLSLKCSEPKVLRYKYLCKVRGEKYVCKLDDSPNYTCPTNCTCEYYSWNRRQVVNCKHSGLDNFPPYLPVFKQANHTELNLEGNLMGEIDVPLDNGYQAVTSINLSNNKMIELNVTALPSSLKMLNLSNNLLTSLSLETTLFLMQQPQLEALALGGNPWICDCDAIPLVNFVHAQTYLISDWPTMTCSNGTLLVNVLVSDLTFSCVKHSLIWITLFFILLFIVLGLLLLCIKQKDYVLIA